jgi:DNA-binding NarL/FixJ family response regulator
MQSTILIIESSQIIASGLQTVLSLIGENVVIKKFSNISDIQHLSEKDDIALILINPAFVQSRHDIFKSLKKEMPKTKWGGILYAYYDQQVLALFDCLIHINDQQEIIKEIIHKQLFTATDADQPAQQSLSEREIEVLRLLVTGNSNKEIGDKLFISTNTVITHRKNISQKTGIKTVSGLTIYAVVKNVISLQNL